MKHERNLFNLRHGELVRIFRKRLGSGPNKQQLQAAIAAAVGGDPMSMTAEELGERVRLTGWEKITLDIRTIFPFDGFAEDFKIFYRERKRQRDRIRARERRRKEKAMTVTPITMTDQRIAKVRAVLKSHSAKDAKNWLTVDVIAAKVGKGKAFAGLKPVSLRRVIHRTVERLAKAGQVQIDTATGKCALPVTLIRWSIFGEATNVVTVTPRVSPRQPTVAPPNDPHKI